eukprot:5044084-Pyramimonas_sp.AAC.1
MHHERRARRELAKVNGCLRHLRDVLRMPQRLLGLVGRIGAITGTSHITQGPPAQPRRALIPTATTHSLSPPLDGTSGIGHLRGLMSP